MTRYCGATSLYCGAGCQAGFGQCGSVPPVAPGSTDCGPTGSNKQCPVGQCCSAEGYCGTDEDYCSDPENCQPDFGRCDSDTIPAGTSTINDPRPALGEITYDLDIFNCVEPHVVALTYDDGPYKYTNELLDVLKQFGFKATFFITGNNLGKGEIDRVEPYPTIVKRMIAEGHQVASHTWSHYVLSNLTHEKRVQQMVKNERAIANIIGKYPTYMRPPYSHCTAQSGCQDDMKALGYHRTYFDLDTTDYLNPAPGQIQNAKDIVKQALTVATNPDYLSIQHDLVEQSVSNLTSYYLGLIKTKGWRGVTVGECLQDPEQNWYRVPGTGQGAPVSTTSTMTSTITSKAPSTSTTAKPSTTSKASATSKTSSKVTVQSTSTSTSKIPSATTSNALTAAPSCLVHQGSFCGTIPAFTGHPACLTSLNSCNAQLKTCPAKAGNTAAGRSACSKYGNDCKNLQTYCGFCGSNCKSTNPRYKSFVLGQ